MIAIGLLIIIGIYLSLFVLVGVKAKTWRARTSWWLVLLLPIILKTWDMPVGYYKYKSVCAAEGGTKVFFTNSPSAKVIRLDAESGFDIDSAKAILIKYPNITAVETADDYLSDSRPRAYSRYERNPESPIPHTFPIDNFTPIIRLLDKVEISAIGKVTTERGASQAEYIITRERESRPIRLELTHFWLKKPDGTSIAKSTSMVFAWTDEKNTLFGRTAAEYCGDDDDGHLLNLVAH